QQQFHEGGGAVAAPGVGGQLDRAGEALAQLGVELLNRRGQVGGVQRARQGQNQAEEKGQGAQGEPQDEVDLPDRRRQPALEEVVGEEGGAPCDGQDEDGQRQPAGGAQAPDAGGDVGDPGADLRGQRQGARHRDRSPLV